MTWFKSQAYRVDSWGSFGFIKLMYLQKRVVNCYKKGIDLVVSFPVIRLLDQQ